MQKVALVTDFSALADASINRVGVPSVKQGDLAALGGEWKDFLPYESVVSSWDIPLIEEMTEEIATVARENNYKLLTTPDLKAATNAYKKGLSEDPYFNGEIGGAMLRAVHRAGAACALASYSVKKEDVEYLDLDENPRAMHELYKKPFLYALENSPCEGVLSSLDGVDNGYQSTNAAFFGDAVGGMLGKDVFVYSKASSCLPDFHSFLKECVSIGGGEVILDRALGRYEQMKSYCEAGSVIELELQGAIDNGSAISGQTLDEAVDRVIDFAYRVNRMLPSARNGRSDLGLRMARESIVLLKNDRILPLAEKTKIAVVGNDCGFAGACSDFEIVGTASGYEKGAAERKAVFEAVRAAKDAQAVLLFLSSDESSRAKLSDDSLTLIEELYKTQKPVIAVLTGNKPVDMAFDHLVSAVLVSPQGGASCFKALESVLTGKYNPSGKLARSYIDYADEYYSVLKSDKNQCKTKVATFVGYRYYDTIGRKVRYPFGHGLSYTSFAYSALEIKKDEVSFTVKNKGRRFGCETAQLYIGLGGSALRPKKELKGFVRVELAAGESKRVSIPLPRSRFTSFDATTLGESVEKGVYRVYVGSSVSDIRLKGRLLLDGEARKEQKENPDEYFRDISNIGKGYRSGAAVEISSLPAKSRARQAFWGVLLITLSVAVILGIDLLQASEKSAAKSVIMLIATALAGISGGVLISEKHFRKNKLQQEIIDQQLRFAMEKAKKTSDSSAAAVVKNEIKNEYKSPDEPHYFDKSLTFEVMCRELQLFAQERGLFVEEKLVRTWIAAMTACRILVVSSKEKSINMFCKILSEYLGTDLFADDAENYVQGADLLEKRNLYYVTITQYKKALDEAEIDKTRIKICLLRHVKKDWLQALVFESEQEIKKRKELPRNFFVIMEVDDIFGIPTSILGKAASLFFEAREIEESSEKTAVRPIGNYQFQNLCRNVRDDFPLDERLWKRVDRLEEECGGESFRFSNSDWIKMEKHCSAFIACGGEQHDALDSAIATELLPTIKGRLKTGRTDDEVVALLEEIFNAQIGESRAYIEKQTMKSGVKKL